MGDLVLTIGVPCTTQPRKACKVGAATCKGSSLHVASDIELVKNVTCSANRSLGVEVKRQRFCNLLGLLSALSQ